MTTIRLGIKHCTKHDVEYKYPFKCPQCEEEARRDAARKFPHANMETRYQHVCNAMFIMIGNDRLPFSRSQFFCGWSSVPGSVQKFDPIQYSGKQLPTFCAPNDGLVQPIMYFDREQAHTAMTVLLDWYKNVGKDLGILKPAGLCIGC